MNSSPTSLSVSRPIVLVVTNIPTPYRNPLFEELSDQLAARGFHLKVLFGAKGYPYRKWQHGLDTVRFDYEVLGERFISLGKSDSVTFFYPGLLRRVAALKPKAILSSGFSPATCKLALQSLVRDTPLLIWSEDVELPARHLPAWRKLMRRLIIKRTRGLVAAGSMARDHLVNMGAGRDRIHIAVNTVDTQFFAQQAAKLRAQDRGDKDGKESQPAQFLYIGQLNPGKRVDLILKAAKAMANKRKDWSLVIVGDGPERENLEAMARELSLTDLVRFEGRKEKDLLPSYIAEARCFLFPTDNDAWGMVLNEAMAGGLPCLASVRAGATADLVEDGVTGFQLDFHDPAPVTARLEWILDNPEAARAMGQAAAQFIRDKASIQVSARSFAEVLIEAAGQSGEISR